MYTLKGKVKKIGNTQRISDSFQKREIVIEVDGKFPQFIQMETTQDRVVMADKVKVGQEVEVTFFLKGREWMNPKDGEVKYFNTLEVWKLETELGKAADKIDAVMPEDDSDSLPF